MTRVTSRTKKELFAYEDPQLLEAGVDEAGRGCLWGPVVTAAVILDPMIFMLPHDDLYAYDPLIKELRDSKQVSEKKRMLLRDKIINEWALTYSISFGSSTLIDSDNILQATMTTMHHSLYDLHIQPDHIYVDGSYFRPYYNIPHTTVVEGDNTYMNIAAASILAKTGRDLWVIDYANNHPEMDALYHFSQHKGYGTQIHRDAIASHGLEIHHRRSFRTCDIPNVASYIWPDNS